VGFHFPSGEIEGFGAEGAYCERWAVDWMACLARAMRPELRGAGPVLVAGREGREATSDRVGDSGSSGMVSVSARDWVSEPEGSPSGVSVSARAGNWASMISSCCLTRAVVWSLLAAAAGSARIRLRLRRGTLRSRGISRSSRGGARSMAAKRDCSQSTKVSILWQERRNWSASARTRITKRFLSCS
jgi:hypothetical protein